MGMFDDLIPKPQAAVAPSLSPQQAPAFAPRMGMFDDLIPGAQQPPSQSSALDSHTDVLGQNMPRAVQEPRFGDSVLKPIFGGSNPITDVYDTFIEPLTEFGSGRPLVDRAIDTVNFAASAPLTALRLPTFGQMAEDYLGTPALRQSEERFVENNPRLIRALGAAGEVAAAGGPLGQGFRMPQAPQQTAQPARFAAQISDDAMRARVMADDMKSLNVKPFGPAVASARRGDNSVGALSQTLADKPVIGTPLQRGARQFVDEMVDAQENIRSGYGSSRTMQGAGGQLRGALDNFKEGRSVDVWQLAPDELDRLASSPPRISTYRDVQAAKYARAENFLPEDKAKAQPVAKGEERVLGGMENTVAVLTEIKRRYGLTINKSEAARARKGRKGAPGSDLSLENTPDFANPRWTGSANIDRSMDAIASARGNWRTGLEGMREIRSSIRRVLSAKPDSEVNALSRGDLKRLYSAVSKDMDNLLVRKEQQARNAGDSALAERYRNARAAYKDADAFTARYAGLMEEAKGLFRVQSDEALAGAVRTAMQDGTKGNLRQLVAMRRMLPKEAVDELASALIVDLGSPTGRASGAVQEAGFTPSRFASQWDSLSPQARRIVFGHRPDLFRALERFARVSRGMADYEALANTSRSGVSNAVWGALATGGAAVVSPSALAALVASMLAGRSAATFLASPLYVNWLTRSQQLVRGGSSQDISRHVAALRRLVQNDPRLSQAIGAASANAANQVNR